MGLSTAAEKFKKALIWLGIGLAALALIWILWLLLSFVWKLVFPPPSPDPNTLFGQISKPFDYNFDPKNIIFELDTPGGKLPAETNILPVFVIPLPESKFKSLDEGKKIATGGGLDSEPTKLSEFEWRFGSKRQPNKSLKVNIVTKNFAYTYDWTTDNLSLNGVFKTSDSIMIAKAKSYLGNFLSLKTDLKSGTGRVNYFKIVGKDVNPVSSYSEANAVRVELFRDNISYKTKEYPVFEANHSLSLINLLIAPINLLEVNFTYWNVDFSKIATYGVKTTDQAYNDLRRGKALVADPLIKFENITITKTSLGYFNPATSVVRFLQPVFNFEGEGLVNGEKKDFQAYILAVTDDYIK